MSTMDGIERVLVTGGAGFIGSHVADALLAAGVQVTVLDNLDPGAHSALPAYLDDRVRMVLGDVRDRSAWDDALDGADAVSYQAGKVGLGVDFADVDAYVANNDVGLAVGLRAMHDRGFSGSFVLASSMVVYGEGRYRCGAHGIVAPAPRRPDVLARGRFEPPCPRCGEPLAGEPVPEDAPTDPRNVYAATKLHQEHLLAAFAREHEVTATALRYHNVYGSRMPQRTPYAGVASIFRSALEAGRPPQVTEDGRQRRNFVHVDDVARANLAALGRRGPGLVACNVGSTESRTVGEMAEALARAFGSEPGARNWPQVTGGFRLGDVRHVFADVARAAEVLGFTAAVPFADGMRRFSTDPLRAPVAGC